MEENFDPDLENKLQAELERFNKAVAYIEQAKHTFTKSQELLESAHSKHIEISNSHKTLKQTVESSIGDLENKVKTLKIYLENRFANQALSLQQEIEKMREDNSILRKEIENIKAELNEIKLIINKES